MVQKMLARLKTLFKALWHILQRLKDSQLLHELFWPPSGLPRGSISLLKDPLAYVAIWGWFRRSGMFGDSMWPVILMNLMGIV